jgi:AcrR family transcriptional regulator
MTKRILTDQSPTGQAHGPSSSDGGLIDASSALWDQTIDRVARDLLSSAVRCFAASGYHATTTRDISTGAGLSPAAMYVHFPSKELVLYEIVRSGHERALDQIADPEIEHAPTAAAGLATLVSRYTTWHALNHVAARVAQYELPGLTPEHYADVVRLRRATNEVFRAAVSRGVEDGSFEPVEVNPVVRAIISLSVDLVRWYRLDSGDSPEQLGALYADLALKLVRR